MCDHRSTVHGIFPNKTRRIIASEHLNYLCLLHQVGFSENAFYMYLIKKDK